MVAITETFSRFFAVSRCSTIGSARSSSSSRNTVSACSCPISRPVADSDIRRNGGAIETPFVLGPSPPSR